MFAQNRTEKQARKGHQRESTRSVVRVGRTSSSHAEWILEAIHELSDEEEVERIGVWLEEPLSSQGAEAGPVMMQGEVWERGAGSGPPEWSRLSGNAPLPMGLLNSGLSCEYEVEGSEAGVILGPLVELHRVLWVPVLARRTLRGLVMLGSRKKQKQLPRTTAERVVDELGMLLELEEERRLAEMRKSDLELHRRVETLAAEGQNANMILGQLAESCTRGTPFGGIGAIFAMIGERKSGLPVTTLSHAAGEEQLLIRAHSGEETWVHAVNQGPLENLWRQAIESRRVVGVDPSQLPLGKETSRIVAIPLQNSDDVPGALLAGLPRRKASLENLERLELRAKLAAETLKQERQAQATLRRQLWNKALLESSEEPVVMVDRHGFIAGMSHGARKLTQTVGTELQPEKSAVRFAELFRPKRWEQVQEWVRTAFQREPRGRRDTFECDLAGGDHVVLTPFASSGQEFIAVRLQAGKSTRHVRRIEDAEEELKGTLEWLEEGVVLFDEDKGILALNARFLQILGLSEEEGRTLRNLEEIIQRAAGSAADPASFAADWRALANNLSDGTHQELALEKPVPQVIERSARPIFSREGKRLGHVEVYRDMTTRRLFQSRMVRAEKLASLGQRILGIMHEISNPLTSILGSAQRMVLRSVEAEPPEEAHRILEEAERATSILRQLLYLSRESRPERRLLSLNDLVERVVDLQRVTLMGGPVHLKVELAERLPYVDGDAGQLQQVLLNLCQNAQQAVEQSGTGTTIGVRTSGEVPGKVRLEVWDDGPGIPESIQARIFDPFFTTKPPGIGTGLGLTIVSGFVRQHGGTVSVQSSPGGGTRFVVDLPAAETAGEAEQREKPTGAPLAEKLPALSIDRRRNFAAANEPLPYILVVEDEPTVANLIADVLRDEGMNVDILPDGRTALDAAQQKSYDLAICDLKMPGVDGQVFYKTLVQRQNPLRERVLFVTGDVLAQRTHEFLERHHLPHVAKPFRVEELILAVRRMLWGRLQAAV